MLIDRISADRQDNRQRKIGLLECISRHDGGWINVWVYMVVSLVLPVFLSVFINTSPFMGGVTGKYGDDSATGANQVQEQAQEGANRAQDGMYRAQEDANLMQGGTNQTQESVEVDNKDKRDSKEKTAAKFIYYICLTSAIVLITLGVSHILTLRNNAREWVPALLASLVLDVIVLIVLDDVVLHPDLWDKQGDDYMPSSLTVNLMAMTTLAAVIVTSNVLLFARVAAALYDGKIDISDITIFEEEESGEEEDGESEPAPGEGDKS